jgi:hypothetical protein
MIVSTAPLLAVEYEVLLIVSAVAVWTKVVIPLTVVSYPSASFSLFDDALFLLVVTTAAGTIATYGERHVSVMETGKKSERMEGGK